MPIRFTLADHVARVTIDRPEVLNAIDAACECELQAGWERIEADPQVDPTMCGEPPRPETLSWLCSRQIAYARAQEKARQGAEVASC